MTVTTKLSVGDYGVFMHNDMVHSLRVSKIEIHSNTHGTIAYYIFNTGKSNPASGDVETITKSELHVFATKKELLESL